MTAAATGRAAETAATEQAAPEPTLAQLDQAPTPAPRSPWWEGRGRERALVVAVLALALALRVAVLQASAWLQEGDDAVNTVMALRILEGDRPIVLVGQHYTLAVEPYAMALSFAAFGVSRVAAKLPVLLWSWLLVGAVWLLAHEVAGRLAGRVAALLVAVPGAFFLVQSLKPWAPYAEVMVVGTLAMLAAIRYWRARAGHQAWAWGVATGGLVGFNFALHPVSIYYWLPVAAAFLAGVWQSRRIVDLGLAAGGAVVGLLPLIAYNLQTGGATLTFLFGGTTGQKADHRAVFDLWWNHDLPLVLGVWAAPGWPRRWLSLVLVGVFVAAVVWALATGRQGTPRSWRPRPLDVPLLLLVSIPLVFIYSGFGGQGLNEWGFDATSRYSIHAWPPLAVVLGAFVAWWWRRSRRMALGLAGVVLAANVYGLVRLDAAQAFQSPYWAKLPPDNGEILAVLRAEEVDGIWANHWAGYALMFDARAAGDRLVAYDWYDVRAGGMDRFPDDRAHVENASRAAFVLVTDEEEPELVQRLGAMGVAYEQHRAAPYVVVIPTSRTVHPSEVTQALDYRY